MTPGGFVVTTAVNEKVEMQLPLHAGAPCFKLGA
jgi:hypothetical protein